MIGNEVLVRSQGQEYEGVQFTGSWWIMDRALDIGKGGVGTSMYVTHALQGYFLQSNDFSCFLLYEILIYLVISNVNQAQDTLSLLLVYLV